MSNIIKPYQIFSSNMYTKRNQLVQHIRTLQDTLQNQKFSNEHFYRTNVLIDSIQYWKKQLNKLENDIKTFEQHSMHFGF